MPGDREPVVGGVRVTDDRRGAFLLGATEGVGTVHGVWGVDGGGVFVRK